MIDIPYYLLVSLTPFFLVVIAILFLFRKELFNRLSARIAALIFASGVATLVLALAYNQITSDTLSTPSERVLQIMLVAIGGPVVIGLLAARFVRRPLRQFNDAIASLEKMITKSNYSRPAFMNLTKCSCSSMVLCNDCNRKKNYEKIWFRIHRTN